MELSKEIIERELEASKAAKEAHLEGVFIHNVVIKAFEKELIKIEGIEKARSKDKK